MAVSSSPLPWHTAFVQAVQLELEPFLGVLSFQSEVPLTSEPLRVDLIVIKKSPALFIEKNIARLFRGVNLLEYKSPVAYISLYDFHKTLGCAFLYSALNRVKLSGMTVSIIGSRYPRKLLKELRREGPGRVTERERGIYEVEGYPLAVQIIESRKLGAGENLWLRGLEPRLKEGVLGEIMVEGGKKKEGMAEAYLYVVVKANEDKLKEMVEMGKLKGSTLEEVLEKTGLTAKWEARGEALGEETGWEKAVSLMEQGYTAEQLKQMGPRGVPPQAG